MKKEKSNNKTISLALLAVILGLLAGITGGLISRDHMLQDLYGLPFGNEFNLSHTGLDSPNLVIKDAKKITVEQEKKIEETIKSSSKSLVGIFEKIPKREEDDVLGSEISLDDFYNLQNHIGQGFVVTSDGWLITDTLPAILNENDIIDNYVVIDSEKEVYEIDEVRNVDNSPFSFLRLKGARGFPVRQIAEEDEIRPGNWVLAVDWEGRSHLNSILKKEDPGGLLKSSDDFHRKIILSQNLEGIFDSAFIFNLKGALVGIYNSQEDKLVSINNFKAKINSLLRDGDIKTPVLGVNYIDLEQLIIDDDDYKQGALIYPDQNGVAIKEGSPAEEAGLRTGDVITSINNVDLESPDKGLSYLIQQYSPGDRIRIIYLREGESDSKDIRLR